LLQSAKRLWTRAILNESNDQDYLNTLSAQPRIAGGIVIASAAAV
jgi:hypothetical protein